MFNRNIGLKKRVMLGAVQEERCSGRSTAEALGAIAWALRVKPVNNERPWVLVPPHDGEPNTPAALECRERTVCDLIAKLGLRFMETRRGQDVWVRCTQWTTDYGDIGE